MDCPSCNAETADGSKFCTQCGASLPLACSSCSHGNPPQAKFCANCGTALTTASPPSPAPAPPMSSAERRHLTVMFCDLVGSTALATRLDPEDLREIVGAYHRAVTDTIARFEGFVAKYMGDGILIYFGYPQAHEDDAERAVRAGLAVITAIGYLDLPERLQTRLVRVWLRSTKLSAGRPISLRACKRSLSRTPW